MASLGIRYDTEDAVGFVTKLYTFLRDTTYDESVRLAQEKGAFMAFDWEKHKNSPYIQRLPKPIQNNIKKYGIRNIALLTQAPNGSMSILMRNCSSGSEPMFLLTSTRNMKVSGTGGDVVQYTLYHQAVQDAFDAGWSKERVAEVFVAAGDVDPRTRVKMQGVMQKLIDSAISITTNLKSTATVQEVRDLYEMAHEYGCKGFTVYRDGCRTGVLNAVKEESEGVNKKVARPKVTSVDIHKTRYKDKNYMILVGKTEGKAIEIFGGEEAGLSLPTQYHSATLTKKSRGHYTLVVQLSEDEEDQLKVNNIGNRFPAQDVMTLTRMISLSLRNGISVGDIVDQLTKASSALYDAPAVFARVLKQYIPDEEMILREKAKGKVCPECGEPLDFRRESGCLVELCSSCSFSNSKCG
jgi:ribonucleoside-diphosphate reductase alpha chain